MYTWSYFSVLTDSKWVSNYYRLLTTSNNWIFEMCFLRDLPYWYFKFSVFIQISKHLEILFSINFSTSLKSTSLKIQQQRIWFKNGQKTLTYTSPKTMYRWQISKWKDAPHLMSSGKCKFEQWDTTIHLSEWQKSRTLTTPSAGQDVEQQELSFIADGNAKWYSHLGRRFGGFLQNYTYFYHPIHLWCSLVVIRRGWKLKSTQKPVYGWVEQLYS